MDSEKHREQASKYLIEPFKRWQGIHNLPAFVGGNSFVYYPPPQAPDPGIKPKPKRLGPDFYLVVGGQSRGQTKWVVWEEQGLYPDLVIELVSPSTESRDRGQKFTIYRDIWKTQDYFLFDDRSSQIEGFRLKRRAYVSVAADQQGRYPCASLPLSLGVQDGWLRWYDQQGQVLPTDEELAQQEWERAEKAQAQAERALAEAEKAQAQAEKAQTQADQERARAELLAARLRELGYDE